MSIARWSIEDHGERALQRAEEAYERGEIDLAELSEEQRAIRQQMESEIAEAEFYDQPNGW